MTVIESSGGIKWELCLLPMFLVVFYLFSAWSCQDTPSREEAGICYPDEHLTDNDDCGCGGPCPQAFACDEGLCASLCGNGMCEPDEGEMCANCPEDCGCLDGDCCVGGICEKCPPVCGDSKVEDDEECDDGNTLNLDGCNMHCRKEAECGDAQCQPEAGENCSSCPYDCVCSSEQCCVDQSCAECPPECGDGVLEGGEECDDGNTEDADGCSALCEEEELCGNGQCDKYVGEEDCETCPEDCGCLEDECCTTGVCIFCHGCGDGVCEPEYGDTCGSCPEDCPCGCGEECVEESCDFTACQEKDCGDDGCGGSCGECGEHYACLEETCVYQPWCGNGTCDPDAEEQCNSCPLDCECGCGEQCLDGECTFVACDGKECGSDGCGTFCGSCQEHYICDSGSCVYEPWCGDNECAGDSGEDCSVCPADCPCGCGEECIAGECIFTACFYKECGLDGCGGSCGSCNDGKQCVEGECVE